MREPQAHEQLFGKAPGLPSSGGAAVPGRASSRRAQRPAPPNFSSVGRESEAHPASGKFSASLFYRRPHSRQPRLPTHLHPLFYGRTGFQPIQTRARCPCCRQGVYVGRALPAASFFEAQPETRNPEFETKGYLGCALRTSTTGPKKLKFMQGASYAPQIAVPPGFLWF